MALSETQKLWQELVGRLKEEIRDCEFFARRRNDDAMIGKVEDLQRWMERKGAILRAELERAVADADVAAAAEMRVSIEAALELLDPDRGRDLNVAESWDHLLQTCRETYPALRRAFRDVVNTPRLEPIERRDRITETWTPSEVIDVGRDGIFRRPENPGPIVECQCPDGSAYTCVCAVVKSDAYDDSKGLTLIIITVWQ